MIEKTQHPEPKPVPKQQPTAAQPHLKKSPPPVRETLSVPKAMGKQAQKADPKPMP
jgi:hypothetical protein